MSDLLVSSRTHTYRIINKRCMHTNDACMQTHLYSRTCEDGLNVEMRLTILATEERELCVVCAKDTAAHPGEFVHVHLVVTPGVLQQHHALCPQVIYRPTVRFPARFRIRITKSFIAILVCFLLCWHTEYRMYKIHNYHIQLNLTHYIKYMKCAKENTINKYIMQIRDP